MALSSYANYQNKIIIPKYRQWLVKHNNDSYPGWVIDRIYNELKKKQRNRVGTLSSSSANSCLRKQILEYLGIGDDNNKPSVDLLSIFRTGKWIHLKLQADLLAAGIIDDIEISLSWLEKRSCGTAVASGIIATDHIKKEWRGKTFGLEIKSMNTYTWNGYSKLSTPVRKHIAQIGRYALSAGWDFCVLLYEDKNTSKLLEWVIPVNEHMLFAANEELDILNDYIDKKKLPDMQYYCKSKKGEWPSCFFRGVCETAKWKDIKKI